MIRSLILSAVVVLGLTGCGNTRTVEVLLTDAPLDGATAVNITVNGLEAIASGGVEDSDDEALPGSTDTADEDTKSGKHSGHDVVTFDPPREINLLELRDGVTTLLGEITYEGDLHQLRLLMDGKATVVFADGSSKDAFVPSGAQTGVKIVNIPKDTSQLTLDFDAAASIHDDGTGDLVMRPTIKAMAGGETVGETPTE